MWVRLPGQQLLRTFPDPFRHPRPHETSVIKKKLQRAQVGITQAPTQKEVIAQARVEIFDHRTGPRRLFEGFTDGFHDLVKLAR